MKKAGSISRIAFMRLAALALVSVFGCALAAAQTTQNQIIAISPGEQIFAVDSAYYKVTVPSTWLVVYTEGDADTQVAVYDSSAKLIAEDDDSGEDLNARINVQVSAGTYYIRVDFYGGSAPYVLHVETPR
jgi:opacity protein-like surface antigen